MPAEDVSDLREVVDAINKLCDTMKSSYEVDYEDSSDLLVQEAASNPVEVVDTWSEPRVDVEAAEMYYSASADGDHLAAESSTMNYWSDPIVESYEAAETLRVYNWSNATVEEDQVVESRAENWGDPTWEKREPVETSRVDNFINPIVDGGQSMESRVDDWSNPTAEAELTPVEPVSDDRSCETYYMASSELGRKSETKVTERWSEPTTETETAAAPHEPSSEMYYTASSEVSLVSEADLMEKVQNDDSDKEKSDRNIMAGHVAAMRERFESMTRANTPCPDLVRSLSPSLDLFRNITPSPDFLDKS